MPENKPDQPQKFHSQLLLFSTLKRSVVAIIEYPFECIKNRRQATPEIPLFKVINNSYKLYGIRSFYDGFIPNSVKKLPVLFIRWPMILELPSYYQWLLKDKASGYPLAFYTNFLTALTIASIETPLAAPFDTCKLDLIIHQRRNGYSLLSYLKENRRLKQHTRGISALYGKEIFGWVSFLMTLDLGRKYIKENGNNPVHLKQLVPLSLCCGITNSVAVTPWDVVRNHLQKHKNNEYSSLKPVIKEIYTKGGARGFFAGAGIRMAQLTVATATSIPIIESYEKERIYQNKNF